MKAKDKIIIFLMLLIPYVAEGKQKVTQLPEVLVESQQRNMLHVLAYVREYSELTTYSDTVTLFREKMVDFMLPSGRKSRYKGWRIPRVIKSESYYHFKDASGLDSVSASSRHGFSWSDWMGLPPNTELPYSFQKELAFTDTLHGKYSPVEIWTRNDDMVTLEVNVLADTIGRRWVPNLKSFFNDDNVEFADFKVKFDYANVLGDRLLQRDLTKYTYRVDARGRGHSMFRFNHREEDFFATTEAEVYVLDMEYISEKEAKKWGSGKYDSKETEVIRSLDAPPLSEEVLALIDRVEHIDLNEVRLNADVDRNMIRIERHRSRGGEALRYLKNITGISDANAKRKQNANWKKFRDSLKEKQKAQ